MSDQSERAQTHREKFDAAMKQAEAAADNAEMRNAFYLALKANHALAAMNDELAARVDALEGRRFSEASREPVFGATMHAHWAEQMRRENAELSEKMDALRMEPAPQAPGAVREVCAASVFRLARLSRARRMGG